jgi:MFS family permease
VSGWTVIRRLTKGKYAQEEMSSWSTVQNVAYIMAPLISGLIISMYSWQLVFYIGAGFSFLSFLYLTTKVSIPKNHVTKTKSLREQWHSFFKDRSAATRLVILTLILHVLYTSVASFLPLHLISFGINIEEISIILSLATTTPFILFPVIIGVVSDKYGRKTPTLFGLLFMALGFFFFSKIVTFTQFLFYTFIIYTGITFIDMSVNAELSDLSDSKEVGGFTGIFESVKDAGKLIGPLLFGFLSSITSIAYSFFILSIVSITSLLILKGFKNF